MVAHPQELTLPAELASTAPLDSTEIEPVEVSDGPDWSRDVPEPADTYDLRLRGFTVAQLVRDVTQLDHMWAPAQRWVLVQKDADLVLAVDSAEEAIARARQMVGARLPELPVRRQDRPRRRRRTHAWIGLVALVCVAAIAIRARRRS